MKVKRDVDTDLSTFSELLAERQTLMVRVENRTATVREVRRFVLLHSLISMFENAQLACRQIRKHNGNIPQQIKQDLIRAGKKASGVKRITNYLQNPVIKNDLPDFQSEEINDI
jgi:hypothetical protein